MVGFEPTHREYRSAAFRVRSLQPLGYISNLCYIPGTPGTEQANQNSELSSKICVDSVGDPLGQLILVGLVGQVLILLGIA